jgi:hypothetical protein
MELNEAIELYQTAAGKQALEIDRRRSYERNNAQHLLDGDGALLAVVFPDGNVTWGAALAAAWRQLAMGLSSNPGP